MAGDCGGLECLSRLWMLAEQERCAKSERDGLCLFTWTTCTPTVHCSSRRVRIDGDWTPRSVNYETLRRHLTRLSTLHLHRTSPTDMAFKSLSSTIASSGLQPGS